MSHQGIFGGYINDNDDYKDIRDFDFEDGLLNEIIRSRDYNCIERENDYINYGASAPSSIEDDAHVKYMLSVETLLKEGIFDKICTNDKTGCLFGTFMDVSNTIMDYLVMISFKPQDDNRMQRLT
jgi:hypothetical protein